MLPPDLAEPKWPLSIYTYLTRTHQTPKWYSYYSRDRPGALTLLPVKSSQDLDPAQSPAFHVEEAGCAPDHQWSFSGLRIRERGRPAHVASPRVHLALWVTPELRISLYLKTSPLCMPGWFIGSGTDVWKEKRKGEIKARYERAREPELP